MSSLAAARADNFYHPPNWDPSKGGLNKFHGTHALRERARKLDQGILIIRFEVPFNIWCNKCGDLIGKGVRFNAEKKQIGNYLSTKIWSFRMRHHCGCVIDIHTDPKNAEYIIADGARRKEESYTADDAQVIKLLDDEHKTKLATDPLYRLEHEAEAQQAVKEARGRIARLKADTDLKHDNSYAANRALRARMRQARNDEKSRDKKRVALGLPEHIKLLPESAADSRVASMVVFGKPQHEAVRDSHLARRRNIMHSSIFDASSSSSAVPPSKRRKLSASTNLRLTSPTSRRS